MGSPDDIFTKREWCLGCAGQPSPAAIHWIKGGDLCRKHCQAHFLRSRLWRDRLNPAQNLGWTVTANDGLVDQRTAHGRVLLQGSCQAAMEPHQAIPRD